MIIGDLPDLSHFWMPFTNNRGFKRDPRLLVSARDMHYVTSSGQRILDGTSGLWCVNAGHCRPAITEAVRRQVGALDFAPTFQLGHPLAFEAASRLAAMMPAGLDRVFLVNSGSEAADTALKIALAYHRARGEGHRTRLIGRIRGYHGTNFGGMSVGGIGPNRVAFAVQIGDVDHIGHTHRADAAFSRGQPSLHVDPADEIDGLVALHGASRIAAVIVEPVAGSTGVLVPPTGYLQRLREATRRHGILLIFDEVITAFGRLGTATAAQYFGVTPDMLTMAKAINNAAVPMGAVAVDRAVHDAIVGAAPPGIELAHGYTYSGHPLAAAAAIATLDLYAEEQLFQRAAELAGYWEDVVHSLADAPHVVDIRNIGLMAGIELASDPRQPAGSRAAAIFRRCFDDGILIRVTGDVIALSPPLIISREQIDELVGELRDAIVAAS